MRNLHLLWDEKITPSIIDNFEAVLPGKNDYIFWKKKGRNPHFIPERKNIYVIDEDKEIPMLDYTQYTKVIIHGSGPEKEEFCLQNIPEGTPIFWVLWGVELYQRLLEPRGYKLYSGKTPRMSFKAHLIRGIKRLGYLSKATKHYLSIFSKRNVTMVCSRAEFDLFRRYYPKQTRKLKNNPDFFYYSVDRILGELIHSEAHGNKVLIGHSNSRANNHISVFNRLKKLDITGKTLITPLSYVDDEEYKKNVIATGRTLFGNSYKPLTEFLKLEEYNKLMLEAEYAVYGSWRQEAFGNIVIALYLGTKVFLSKRNPLHRILREMGLIVYTLEEMKNDSLQIPLTKEERKNNRDIILNNFCRENMKKNIINLFE